MHQFGLKCHQGATIHAIACARRSEQAQAEPSQRSQPLTIASLSSSAVAAAPKTADGKMIRHCRARGRRETRATHLRHTRQHRCRRRFAPPAMPLQHAALSTPKASRPS